MEYTKEIKIGTGLAGGSYLYFLDKDHPLASGAGGLVYYHRHIASLKEGRWLRTSEHVHHIDGNKLNNDSSNLEVLSQAEHARLHKVQQGGGSITKVCPTCAAEFTSIISNNAKCCSAKCANISLVKDISVTKEMLDELIPVQSWGAIGKLFGYSDSGIKKRAIALGCDISKAKHAHKKTKDRNSTPL